MKKQIINQTINLNNITDINNLLSEYSLILNKNEKKAIIEVIDKYNNITPLSIFKDYDNLKEVLDEVDSEYHFAKSGILKILALDKINSNKFTIFVNEYLSKLYSSYKELDELSILLFHPDSENILKDKIISILVYFTLNPNTNKIIKGEYNVSR